MKDKYGDCWTFPLAKIKEMVKGLVPTNTKVNGKALTGDISLTASDVNAVPKTRTVNGKALSSNISLTAEDVGAVAVSDAQLIEISSSFEYKLTGGTQKIKAFYDPITKWVNGFFSVVNAEDTVTLQTDIYKCANSDYYPNADINYCGLFSTTSTPSNMMPALGVVNTSGGIRQSYSSSVKNCFGIFQYKVAEATEEASA